MSRVLVTVRMSGGGYVARAGRGKAARIASSTNCERVAVQAAAAKYFKLDGCNVLQADQLLVTRVDKKYLVELP